MRASSRPRSRHTCRCRPVALRYGAHGRAQTTVAFGPGESWPTFLRLLGEPSREAEVSFLQPVHVDDVVGRRHIADTARARILEAMSSMLTAADYLPPRWLRNPHLQSMLSSAALRRRRGLQALQRSGAVEQTLILDGGDGVRLQGVLSTVPGRTARGLTLLLHGWEWAAPNRATCA